MKPNIILILLDDMGWRDLGCYGSDFYESPAIDRLAAQGMRFTDAYAASPVCSPSRASLLTGKYPARVGVTHYIGAGEEHGKLRSAPYVDHLPLEEYSLAKALRDNGYATWNVGKWHLGNQPYYPENHGFDVNIGGCHYSHPYYGYFSPWKIENLPEGQDGDYLTDRLTDEAIGLIRKRDPEKPFFLMLSHYAVHIPIQAKQEDIAYFEGKARRLGRTAENSVIECEEFPAAHLKGKHVRRRVVQSDPTYAAMILDLDRNTQRLLDTMTAEGLDENTVVIFTSDNGGLATSEGSPTCNAPLAEGKGWMYEGGLRVPLIVRYPGHIQPRATCDVPVMLPDLYPTLLETAGLELLPKQHVDGRSFASLLREPKGELIHDCIFWHFPHYGNQGGLPGCAVRWKDYVLIRFFEERQELYRISDDISQSHDLLDEQPQIAAMLSKRLDEWLTDVGAVLPEKVEG